MVVLFSREECLSAAPGARRVGGRLYLPTNPQRQALPTAPARPHQRRQAHRRSLIEGGFVVVVKVAATNKCLARRNKARTGGKATSQFLANQCPPYWLIRRFSFSIVRATMSTAIVSRKRAASLSDMLGSCRPRSGPDISLRISSSSVCSVRKPYGLMLGHSLDHSSRSTPADSRSDISSMYT